MKKKTINPVAKALRDPNLRPRIVKSKVRYNRKRSNKGCDNLSHLF